MNEKVHIAIRRLNKVQNDITHRIEIYDCDKDGFPIKIKESLEVESIYLARDLVENDLRSAFRVLSVQELSEEEEFTYEKKYVMPKPTYITYKLPIEEFNIFLEQWFEREKGLVVKYKIFNEVDYFEISISENDREVLNFFEEEYGEFEHITKDILMDVFGVHKLDYEFSFDKQILYVNIPIREFSDKHYVEFVTKKIGD